MEHEYEVGERGAVLLNQTDIPTSRVISALDQQGHPELAALVRWSHDIQRPSRGAGGLFERDRYVTPHNIFHQIRTAYDAAQHDDIVAGVLEMTEGLALSRMSIESDDEDEQNILNQIAEDLDLDSRLREIWRELFIASQCYVAVFRGRKSYKVKGKSGEGVKRKKQYNNILAPIGLGLLDPLKVIPVGNLLFNQERLAYWAYPSEARNFMNVLAGENTSDLAVLQFIEGPYKPTEDERILLGELEITPSNLFLLRKDAVFRITDTRPMYERFANVRMKSVFELLDLKQQLKQMDRAYLLGNTNFVLLIKKGTDDMPAKPAEVQALAAQVRTASRVPVIVGDHRISIEIITPKLDVTLRPERYNTLDSRLEARLFGMFFTGSYTAGSGKDDSVKLARVVAKGLENRRTTMRRALEKYVLKPFVDGNEQFTGDVNLVFHPRHIALDFDPSWTALLQDFRDRGDISRETALDELDLDQDDEARRREIEAERYDKIFQSAVPFSSPQTQPFGQQTPGNPAAAPAAQKQAGRTQGGNRQGGGNNPDSKTSNSNPVRPRKGKTS